MSYEASVTVQANFARKGYDVIYKPSNVSFFVPYELLANVTDAEWRHAIYGGPDTLHMLLWKKEQDMYCNPYISHSDIPKFAVHKDEAVLPPPKFQKEKPKKSSVPWDSKKKSSADKLAKLSAAEAPALVLVDLGEGMLVPKKFVEEVILAEPDYDAKYPSMDDLKFVLDLIPKP